MIFIISSIEDLSTNDVIDWLRNFDQPFIRINNLTKIKIIEVLFEEIECKILIEIENQKVWLNDVKSVWYRRSSLNIDFNPIHIYNKELSSSINNQLQSENYYLQRLIDFYLKPKMLNNIDDCELSKLEILKIAIEIGLKVPKTLITSNKNCLQEFSKNNNHNIISKNLSPGFFVKTKDYLFGTWTNVITKDMIDEMDNEFYPMLFQENIDKVFELRIFYLNKECFASAIFSQNDEKTKVDFRNYNFEKPNRTPPFEIPFELKEKLIILMEKIKLNSGSIDILVNKSGDFIFLEVNPIGQFSQVSIPCNFNLEKKIAESLIFNRHERSN